MTEISIFEVKRSPWPYINKILRGADLGVESASLGGVSEITKIWTITWKDGAKVDIEKTKLNIKNALESLGYDVYSVTQESEVNDAQNM